MLVGAVLLWSAATGGGDGPDGRTSATPTIVNDLSVPVWIRACSTVACRGQGARREAVALVHLAAGARAEVQVPPDTVLLVVEIPTPGGKPTRQCFEADGSTETKVSDAGTCPWA